MDTASQEAQSVTTEGSTTEATTVDEVSGQETVTSYVNGKYNSVTALEEGYTNLQKKLGSFTGAPEEYSIDGIEYNAEHPLFSELQKYGKDNNLSNEGYQGLVNVLLENEKFAQEEAAKQRDEVIKGLGENGHARIQNIDDFLNANAQLSEEQVALVEEAKGLPGGVELLEAFISMGKAPKPASDTQVETKTAYSRDKLKEMQFAKDEFGNRKMSSDPAYRKMVDDYHAKLLAQG